MFVIRPILEPLRRCLHGINKSRKLMEIVFDPYRPELHYMRGPGPKWHARYKAVAGRKSVETVG